VLGRPAKFIIDTIDPNAEYLRHMFGENGEKFSDMPPARTIRGVVTQFIEFETSADQTRYKLVIEPRTADLARGKKSRLFQKQSVQEIITETLQHYGYGDGVDFKFQLRAQYKCHEYITQYHESTFAFIQRIAAHEGIWFRFEQVKNRDVIVFGDDLDAYARYQRTVPLRRESGLDSAGAQAIKTLVEQPYRGNGSTGMRLLAITGSLPLTATIRPTTTCKCCCRRASPRRPTLLRKPSIWSSN